MNGTVLTRNGENMPPEKLTEVQKKQVIELWERGGNAVNIPEILNLDRTLVYEELERLEIGKRNAEIRSFWLSGASIDEALWEINKEWETSRQEVLEEYYSLEEAKYQREKRIEELAVSPKHALQVSGEMDESTRVLQAYLRKRVRERAERQRQERISGIIQKTEEVAGNLQWQETGEKRKFEELEDGPFTWEYQIRQGPRMIMCAAGLRDFLKYCYQMVMEKFGEIRNRELDRYGNLKSCEWSWDGRCIHGMETRCHVARLFNITIPEDRGKEKDGKVPKVPDRIGLELDL